MASADFRFDIRTPREARSQWHQIGSPQVRHTSFLPVHRIYVSDSCMSIGYWVVVPPHPSEPPHIRFLFVEHAFCYRLPPDLVLPLRPCRVANPSPHRAGSGFSPYRSAPCWAHTHKADNLAAAGLSPFGYDRVRIIHNKTTMTRTVSIFKSPFHITTSCGIIFHEVRNVVTISFLINQTQPVFQHGLCRF